MACDSLNQQTNLLTVTLGALPEGFCPSSMQELGEAIASRLIVAPTQSSSSFAIGPIAPTSNVGPWLKNCEEWFVWDDVLAMYVKMRVTGAFNNRQIFTSSGNFTVPNDIFFLKCSVWGGGGGGGAFDGNAGGGGGGGGYSNQIIAVTPGQIVAVTVGSGGAAGAPGTNGGNSNILTATAGGGIGGQPGASGAGGAGGVSAGGDINMQGQPGNYGISVKPGDGGDCPTGGNGGKPDTANNPLFINGQFPGGGGGAGGTGLTAGNGANGLAVIEY